MTNEQFLQQMQPDQQIGTSSLGIDTDAMMQQVESLLLWGALASITIFISFLLLYILSARRKWKMQKAIFDIQKTLHEMNEREKARGASRTPLSVTPSPQTITAPITPQELSSQASREII
jgi:flagellar biosynthesis/type III secretory pathway M-ring protein FliF/YscJ